MIDFMLIQLTLEQHGLELSGSGFFSINRQLDLCILRFHIRGFNQLQMQRPDCMHCYAIFYN